MTKKRIEMEMQLVGLDIDGEVYEGSIGNGIDEGIHKAIKQAQSTGEPVIVSLHTTNSLHPGKIDKLPIVIGLNTKGDGMKVEALSQRKGKNND